MAKQRTAEQGQMDYIGQGLVALGLTALLADVSFLVQPLASLIGRLKDGIFEALPTLGGAILNVTQAIAFHEVNYVTVVWRILVLFVALVAVIVGVARLHARRSRRMGREAEGLVDSMRGDC